ncbi:MAG TPA: hypothetical protein VFU32_00030 [Ktedonobacterales bacterium]|nr:hypothetical protein [Ktedonobacterales bacterium]
MKIVAFLKAKLVVTVIAGVVLAGGATAVLAATPAGGQIFHAASNSAQVTKTPDAGQPTREGQTNTCPGLTDAQNLAGKYTLSSENQSSAVQAICALHSGTFKGTTPGGSAISSSRLYGYGEIDQLLTYARYLATHDKANSTSSLTDGNVESYLAEALQSCGSSPIEQCLKTNIPDYQPGTGSGDGNGNGRGKPTGSPTPHH